jgi:glycosyltransferase involved in cell wall biosynthesis
MTFRVLVVEPDFNENGAVRVSLDRARRWMDMGAEVTNLFVSAHHEGSRVAVPAGLRTIAANAALRSARWMLPGALARGLPEALRADVVVAGREIASGLLIGTLLAKLARRPLAVTIHSNVEAALKHHGTPRHRRNVLACLRSAHLLVPVAQGLVRGLVDLGIRKDRIEVVENGFEPALIRANAAQEPATALPPGPFLFALGRLSEQKGFDTLIAAHARALQQGAPPHRLLIAGEGPDLEHLKALAAEQGVTDSVTFAGFLHDPHAVLARADLFVLPSRWEGFPLALSEAVLLGTPAIATDCVSGPREILDEGRFGDLVPVNDEEALAQAITMHLKEPGRLRSRAAAGAHHVETRYTAEGAARAHLEALKRLRHREPSRHAMQADAGRA